MSHRLRSTLAIAALVLGSAAAAAAHFGRERVTAVAPSLRFPIDGPVIPTLSCSELRAKAVKDTAWSYTKALASTGLSYVELGAVELTLAQAQRTREDGTVVIFVNGKPQVGVFEHVERATKDSSSIRFVRDEHGDIWTEERRPQTQLVARCGRKPCTPASGIPPRRDFGDVAWVLPEGARFRGVIEVAYDAWEVAFTDHHYCPPRP